jgi:ribosomal protein L37E
MEPSFAGAEKKLRRHDWERPMVGAHRGSTDDCSVRAFAVKPRACGAPLCGFGA